MTIPEPVSLTPVSTGPTSQLAAAEPADLPAHLAETMRWHFDPATGSPFWLRRVNDLDFSPVYDVRSQADLRRFPDLSAELRTTPIADLIPAGFAGRPFDVYESGGAIGTPKRIIEGGSRARGVAWVSTVLASHGFPASGDWLHVGPTGPHIVGRSMRRLAELRHAFFFTIDFDPRWVRSLIKSGRRDIADEYVEHVLDQVELVAASQDIRVLFITPPVLEALCARSPLRERLAARLRGMIWSGTSIDAVTLQLVEQHYFPETTVVGLYGNSLMGIAPQRPRLADDTRRCVFQTYWPHSVVEVVDQESGNVVRYGERGRVLVHLLTRDMFLPNVTERDTAVRERPAPDGAVDGLAEVAPYRPADSAVVEGVY